MTLPTCQSFKVIFNEHEEKKTQYMECHTDNIFFSYDKCHMFFFMKYRHVASLLTATFFFNLHNI